MGKFFTKASFQTEYQGSLLEFDYNIKFEFADN